MPWDPSESAGGNVEIEKRLNVPVKISEDLITYVRFLHQVNTAGSVRMSMYLPSGMSACLFLGVDMLPSFQVC